MKSSVCDAIKKEGSKREGKITKKIKITVHRKTVREQSQITDKKRKERQSRKGEREKVKEKITEEKKTRDHHHGFYLRIKFNR